MRVTGPSRFSIVLQDARQSKCRAARKILGLHGNEDKVKLYLATILSRMSSELKLNSMPKSA
jgi:hypothetical protein